jgi:hypothetical protein
LYSHKRGLKGDRDMSFNVRKKLDSSSMSPSEGTFHRLDKDVRTIRPSILMQPPRSPRQPSSSYNSPLPRPPTRGPPSMLSHRKSYGVPTSLSQTSRTPHNVPLASPPLLSQTTPTNAPWSLKESSPIANRSSEQCPSFFGSDSESPVIDK